MIKNITKVEAVVNERSFILHCEIDAPVVDMIEALDQMKGMGNKIIADAQAQKEKEEECLST